MPLAGLVHLIFYCCDYNNLELIIIHREAREIIELVASVCPFAWALTAAAKSKGESLPVKSVCLCVCNPWAYEGNRADAVDRLLIKA